MARSRATREAALLTAEVEAFAPRMQNAAGDALSSEPLGRITRSRAAGRKQVEAPVAQTETETQEPPKKKQGGQKKRKSAPENSRSDVNELPHNLGSVSEPTSTSVLSRNDAKDDAGIQTNGNFKSEIKSEEVDTLANKLQTTVDKATETLAKPPSSEPKKKAKKASTYGLTPGVTPFPDWVRPTPEECDEVNRLLSSIHGEITAPSTIPEPSLTVTGCGEVPSVLDALIRTLLSGATTGKNSAMAFNGLVQKFGILDQGIGKGSVNWDAVRKATVKDVYEAIKSGGLADIKSKNLKAILDMVYNENQARRDILVKGEGSNSNGAKPEEEDIEIKQLTAKPEGAKQYEIACADQNFLSLNHLHSLGTEDAMRHLVQYPGIGPKTAACVLLFCLQRPCFAVDTHIFRICKWLNWVPPSKSTEITAFSHLEVRIPDHLKYSLHQLFIRHGKSCPRCRAITGQGSAGWEEGCVIEHLVTRTGKRKGPSAKSDGVEEEKSKKSKG